MGSVSIQHALSRVIGFTGLALIVALSSGCATRALMSSDRYEKPSQQYYSSDASTVMTDDEQLALEQAYLVAINQ